MSLPSTRNRTYVAGSSKVVAADMNDLQDMIVGKKHGEIWRWVPLVTPPQGWSLGGTNTPYITPDGTTVIQTRLPLIDGDRLLELAAIVYDNDRTKGLSLNLNRVTVTLGGAPPSAQSAGSATSSTTGTVEKISVTPARPEVVSQTKYLIAEVAPSGASTELHLYGLLMRYDRL